MTIQNKSFLDDLAGHFVRFGVGTEVPIKIEPLPVRLRHHLQRRPLEVGLQIELI